MTSRGSTSSSRQTPNVCRVAPSSNFHVEDVHNAGGVHTILGSVERGRPGLLHLACPTVSGKTLGENIADFDVRAATVGEEALELAAVRAGGRRTNRGMSVARAAATIRQLSAEQLGFDPQDCIREVDRAYSDEGGLVILYGNLAPNGAVIKAAGVKPAMLRHSGPAVIFEAETEAYEGIVSGKVKAGDVVIIRYEGPRGGPGHAGDAGPHLGHQGDGPGRQGGAGDRRPFFRRYGGGVHRARQPRGRRRRADRPAAAGDIVDIDVPGHKLSVRLSEAELAAAGQGLAAASAALHDRLPGQVCRHGHQRRHRRGAEVGQARGWGLGTGG